MKGKNFAPKSAYSQALMLLPISKKNFVTDVYAVKQIMNIIKKGGRVILFPEGMSSISGHNQHQLRF